jgi:AcrR family transcriptional regulator
MTGSEMADLIRPAKQARSRLTRDRLLAAGRKLLNQGAFEATSIGDIADVADCSVGAFYQRFADKEAFFAAVVETVLADIAADARQFATAELLSKAAVELVLAECITFWILTFRRHRGFIRTLMKKTLHVEEAWTPFREMGRVAVEPFVGLLAAKCGQTHSNSFRYRARAGFQIVIGVTLNASLHRTVLLNLDSDELLSWASEILRHCLFDELPPALLAYGSGTRDRPRTLRRQPVARRSSAQ